VGQQQVILNREPYIWIINYTFHWYLINVLCDIISVFATNRCMYVVTGQEDSSISDYVQWNVMHELRTAAMKAKLFYIILRKTNGLLSYFGQGDRVTVR